jgi:hypothetical protein
MNNEPSEKWLRDTGLTCIYDEEPLEYTDAVIALRVVKPYLDQTNGALMFYDIPTEGEYDYYYEPVFFHSYNWDAVEEKLEEYLVNRQPIIVQNPLILCKFCKSGVLAGETMGIATLGEIIRSQRNPELKSYGNHFENLDRNPYFICISCLMDLNNEVHEIWPEGVCHGEECEEGTYARCWRAGCPGNCPKKVERSADEEEEEDE